MRSFFLEAAAWPRELGGECRIEGPEVHHMATVLRLAEGDELRLTDGCGRDGVGKICAINKKDITVQLVSSAMHPQAASQAVLAVAWTKAARRSWLMEKAVEFHAAGIWLWQSDRSQTPVPDEVKESWQAQLIAGAKQCENPWLPELRTFPKGASELAEAANSSFAQRLLLWEDQNTGAMLDYSHITCTGKTLYIIGPEGGLTEREVNIFKEAGCTPLSLGNSVLRWESAAMLCLGLQFWGSQLRA